MSLRGCLLALLYRLQQHDENVLTVTLVRPKSIETLVAQLKPSVRPRLAVFVHAPTPIPAPIQHHHLASALQSVKERSHPIALNAMVV
jgi:hypothetical protein